MSHANRSVIPAALIVALAAVVLVIAPILVWLVALAAGVSLVCVGVRSGELSRRTRIASLAVGMALVGGSVLPVLDVALGLAVLNR